MAKRNDSNRPDRDEDGRNSSPNGNYGWQRDPMRQPEVARGERSEGYRGGNGNRYEEEEDKNRSAC